VTVGEGFQATVNYDQKDIPASFNDENLLGP
jgi:hypothetical protein